MVSAAEPRGRARAGAEEASGPPRPECGCAGAVGDGEAGGRGLWDQQRWRRPRRRERPGRRPQLGLQPGPRGCLTGAVGGGPELGPGSGGPPPPPRRGTGTGRGAVAWGWGCGWRAKAAPHPGGRLPHGQGRGGPRRPGRAGCRDRVRGPRGAQRPAPQPISGLGLSALEGGGPAATLPWWEQRGDSGPGTCASPVSAPVPAPYTTLELEGGGGSDSQVTRSGGFIYSREGQGLRVECRLWDCYPCIPSPV